MLRSPSASRFVTQVKPSIIKIEQDNVYNASESRFNLMRQNTVETIIQSWFFIIYEYTKLLTL